MNERRSLFLSVAGAVLFFAASSPIVVGQREEAGELRLFRAAAWVDSKPVYLVQDVTKQKRATPGRNGRDWYVEYGRLLVLADGRVRPIAGYEDHWEFDGTFSRSQSKGFMAFVKQFRTTDDAEHRCLLISPAAVATRCSHVMLAGMFQAGATDQFVVDPDWPDRRPRLLDIEHGESKLQDSFLELPFGGMKELPCPLISSVTTGLAPDRAAWAVECDKGLWILERSGERKLVMSFDGVGLSPSGYSPDWLVANGWIAAGRGSSHAWSPASDAFYYCDGVHPRGVLVLRATLKSNFVDSCLTDAVWSDDGKRVAGATLNGAPGADTLR